VEYVQGTDAERGCSYEGWAASGFHPRGFDDPLKVVRVCLRRLKGKEAGKTETFWVLTTDLTLSAEQMLKMFLACTLVLAFHAPLDREVLWKAFRLRRVTLAYLDEASGGA